jgi:hypothetical protein
MTSADEPAPRRRRPWRSAAAGWAVAALALLAGVPLFLCLPPWNDVTLHDMAARSVLRGGVHYRDVFDTNLPGIDWAMAAVRALFGRSYEALRAVDLVVIGAAVAVLCGWVRRCGARGYSAAWLAAAAALFYPFTSEFNHVQRDPWMLLPAAVAARLRLKQLGRSEAGKSLFLPAVLEGFVWGLAVWVKPHAVAAAFAVWAASAAILARRESRRRLAADFAGLIVGGVLAGVPGVAWLVGTGAWPYFLDIFLNWNPSYLSQTGTLGSKLHTLFTCFGAWSAIHFAALPLALCALWEAFRVVRSGEAAAPEGSLFYSPAPGRPAALARALLAAFYLGWFVQAVLLQKQFEYTYLPLTLLALAVVAAQRWCVGFAYLLWFALVGLLVSLAHLPLGPEPHRLTQPGVLGLWPRCWREGSSPELRDRLGQYTQTPWGTNWEELDDVAKFLRAVEPPLGPGELNCWHDTTHPLYLTLDLDPATRYVHYGTAFGIRTKREAIAEEVRASRQRYVVSDLVRMIWDRDKVYDPASWRTGDPLPLWLPPGERRKFPWNQPVVFRSGRYLVHKVDRTKPLGVIRVTDWDKVDRLGELGPDE